MMVSYAASLIRRLYDEFTITFPLRMTIEPVVLIYYISIGAILAFDIDPISSVFLRFDT